MRSRRRFLGVCAALAAGGGCGVGIARSHAAYFGKPWSVPSNTTLSIDLATSGLGLAAALEAVLEWHIPATSWLQIRIPDGIHQQGAGITLRHPDGARLQILGNTSNPAACRLEWRTGVDALYAGAGARLGWIDGVTLLHATRAARGRGSALLADEGGVILCGPNVAIDGFYYGVQARRNGVVRCAGISCRGGGDANFFAFLGGHIYAPGSFAFGASDEHDALRGSGYVAEYGGSIDAYEATAESNRFAGFNALSNGAIRAYRSRARKNGGAGYRAETGGVIVAHDGEAARNCGTAVDAVGSRSEISATPQIRNIDNQRPAQECALAP